jgi:hypothetical protein
MVSVKCVTDGCDLKNVDFNVLGNHEVVECGACAAQLKPFDLRDDPADIKTEVSE